MSQKRRDKAKAKERRHGASLSEKPDGNGTSTDTAKANRLAHEEKVFLRSADHLTKMAPEWQHLYNSIRMAVKEMA